MATDNSTPLISPEEVGQLVHELYECGGSLKFMTKAFLESAEAPDPDYAATLLKWTAERVERVAEQLDRAAMNFRRQEA